MRSFKTMLARVLAAASIGLASLCPACAAAAESPSEFGYTAPIAVREGQAFQAARLPALTYRHAARPDLGDLRVFNGAGEAVPHALRLPEPVRDAEQRRKLPMFPLITDVGSPLDAQDIRIEVRADGGVVRVRSAHRATGTKPNAWILDASTLGAPVKALDFTLAEDPSSIASRVSVEASDDLSAWHAVVSEAPIVRMRFGGERLAQLRVDAGATRSRYLRVVRTSGDALPIVRIDALLDGGAPRHAHDSISVDPVRVDSAAHAWEYDLESPLAVERATLDLAEDNTVLAVEIEARTGDSAPWIPVGRGVVYRLQQNGASIVNTPLMVSGGPLRHVRVRLGSAAAAMPSKAPRLRVEWRPAEIVFAARGAGPFVLAYGKSGADSTAIPLSTLVPGHGTPDAIVPATATIGAESLASGDAARRERTDYRKLGLWGLLIAGVVVFGAMALKLMKESTQGGEDKAPASPGEHH